MSSRLMTMKTLLKCVRKFMQRAAASTPPTAHRLQSRGAETPPSKRQKSSHTPTSAARPNADQHLIQAALGEEEEKRVNAIERLAAQAGETKWVLSTVNIGAGEDKQELRIEVAGYSDIDQDAWRPAMVGRRSFGKFNRELEKHQNGTAEMSPFSSAEMSNTSDENSEDGENGENSDEATSKEKLLKHKNAQHLERKQLRKTEKSELARLAEKRRKKEIKLNRLTAISGDGGGGSGPSSGRGDKTCYECGEKGHERRACPQKGKRKNQDSPSVQRKRSRPSLEY